MIISPYILNYGASAYDMRKVAMYSIDGEDTNYVNVRFVNINDTSVRLPKAAFETQLQAAMNASLTTQNVVVDSAGWTYYGEITAIGSWRVGRLGNDLVSQRNDAGTYITKNTIVA